MKFKKEILAGLTCVVVLAGIFLSVNIIGINKSTSYNNEATKNTESENIKEEKADEKKDTSKKESNEIKNEDNKKQQEQKTEKEIEEDKKTKETNSVKKDDVKEGLYTIKQNDTLYSIAAAYMPNHSLNEVIETIMKRNNLKDANAIVNGKEIIIPYEISLEGKSKKENNKDKENNKKDSAKKYEVKSGDSLYSIAKEFMPKVSIKEAVEQIKQSNNISDENSIKTGQVLSIPQN